MDTPPRRPDQPIPYLAREMLLYRTSRLVATLVRLVGLGLVVWSVLSSDEKPGFSGRGLVVSVLLGLSVLACLVWTVRPDQERKVTAEMYLMALAGGALTGASPSSAASAFAFTAVVTACVRGELPRAAPVGAFATLALAISSVVYDDSAVGMLAYFLGFAAAMLGASNVNQALQRAEQAELLLAQTQLSHEEQLRAARLEESARIAREIHDVLAHSLAGLAIQLEATAALVAQGADRDLVGARLLRAHELARDGLREARRAVGALRGESVSIPAGIETLVKEYQATSDGGAELTVAGNPGRLSGAAGEAILRTVQEALTNVRKHAPGAEVRVSVSAGEQAQDELAVVIEDRPAPGHESSAPGLLHASGGGYGLRGMRERALTLGGTLSAGPSSSGWRVELRLPAHGVSGPAPAPAAGGSSPASASEGAHVEVER